MSEKLTRSNNFLQLGKILNRKTGKQYLPADESKPESDVSEALDICKFSIKRTGPKEWFSYRAKS